MRENLRRDGGRLARIVLASVIFAFNINCFVHGAGLIPGGFSGLTILLQTVADQYFHITLPYTLINLLLNAFPAVIAFRFIGKKFTVLSCICVVLTSVLVDVIPGVRISDNSLLLSIFGGIISGFAASLCFNADATGGGTDFISIYLSERRNVDAFNIILGGNVAMLCVAGLLLGWERAMYSIIFQFTSTQVVKALFSKYQKQTLFIVTGQPDRVYELIRSETHHGATLFRGEGLYRQEERAMVYTVVSRQEAQSLIRKVQEADPAAFVNSIRTQSLSGRFYQRPND